jgi:predicted phosphoribosyltransferase
MLFDRISRNFQLRFKNRSSAANILADATKSYLKKEPKEQILVLGIPRGGVVTADIFASKLSIPNFDIVMPRKLTDPYNKELAIGAIMEDGTMYLDQKWITGTLIPLDYIEKEKLEQIAEIKRRTALYRANLNHNQAVPRATTILVDDGAATGATIITAARWIRKQSQPKHFIIALPVAPKSTVKLLARECDSVEVIITPSNFHSVGQYYEDFDPVTDDQVIDVLSKRSMSSL